MSIKEIMCKVINCYVVEGGKFVIIATENKVENIYFVSDKIANP